MNKELRQVINEFEQIFQYVVDNNGKVTINKNVFDTTITGVRVNHPDNGIDHFELDKFISENHKSFNIYTSVDLNNSRYALILTDKDNFICREYHLDQYNNLSENTISLDEYKKHLESWKNTVEMFIKYKINHFN